MTKLLPTLLPILTAIIVGLAEPARAVVAQYPIAAFLLALAAVIVAHWSPPPSGGGKVATSGMTLTLLALVVLALGPGCGLLPQTSAGAHRAGDVSVECGGDAVQRAIVGLGTRIAMALATDNWFGALDALVVDLGSSTAYCAFAKYEAAAPKMASLGASPGPTDGDKIAAYLLAHRVTVRGQ